MASAVYFADTTGRLPHDKLENRAVNSGTYAVNETNPGALRISRKAGSIFFGEGDDAGWGLGAVVGALDGYIDIVEIDAKVGEVYFVRFSQGELVPMEEALPLMDGLENVTPLE